MKIAAIVIVFHPEVEAFISNLNSYYADVDYILIWMNSLENIKLPTSIQNKVVYCGSGQNEYIARPLNYAINWCIENGCEYLLTMDQDSTWDNFSDFIKQVRRVQDLDTAIYAPNVNSIYSKNESFHYVESVITSGSLLNIKIAYELKGFREDYQIYWVDGEFCHWLRLNGYKIKVLPHYNLKHLFGKETKTLLGYKTSNYSPIVYYFLIRNMLWMKREYVNNPSLRCILYTIFYNIRGIILGENNKIIKITMIGKAFWHGLFQPIYKRYQL
ncbi:glycosyltransferase family protein [Bacteroides faecis]|uniref:hypothetical protein n=1 Tax=Bacteroides faecis TaxID=674529 RepID=UPI0011068254|nr:hypothetical protein [Bacteroides faecis]MDC7979365.1 hypothetical protein [Bacteroides faecis]